MLSYLRLYLVVTGCLLSVAGSLIAGDRELSPRTEAAEVASAPSSVHTTPVVRPVPKKFCAQEVSPDRVSDPALHKTSPKGPVGLAVDPKSSCFHSLNLVAVVGRDDVGRDDEPASLLDFSLPLTPAVKRDMSLVLFGATWFIEYGRLFSLGDNLKSPALIKLKKLLERFTAFRSRAECQEMFREVIIKLGDHLKIQGNSAVKSFTSRPPEDRYTILLHTLASHLLALNDVPGFTYEDLGISVLADVPTILSAVDRYLA